MADKYLDTVNGDDANSGNFGFPWRTYGAAGLTAFLSAGAIGDRLICSGTYQAVLAQLNSQPLPAISARDGFTFMQYEGHAQHVIRCDAPLVGVVWTNVSGDIWTATLPTGLGTPTGMTVDYDVSTFTGFANEAINYGICDPQVDDATVDANPWSFRYVSGTGACRLNCPGRDPNVSTVTMVRQSNPTQLVMTNCIEATVIGLHFRLVGINQGGGGYGIYGDSCYGTLVQGCRFYDHGAHSLTFAGTANENNTSRENVAFACAANSTQFVSYVNSAVNDVTGALFDGDRAHVLGYRDGANEDVSTPATMQGFFGHADGGGSFEDIEFRRTGSYVYMPTPGASAGGRNRRGYGLASVGSFAGAWNDRTARKVRYVECFSRNDTMMPVEHAPYHLRCSYHFTQTGPSDVGGTSGAAVTLRGGNGPVVCKPLFEACEIIVNQDRASGFAAPVFRALFDTFSAGEGAGLVGCSVVNVGTDGNTDYIFHYQAKANVAFFVYGSILGHANKSGALCQGDSGFAAAVHEFRQNLYLNVGVTLFSENTALNEYTLEWNVAVDSTNALRVTSLASMAFADLSINTHVRATSVARASISPAEQPINGLNGALYAGDYGCMQYPSISRSGTQLPSLAIAI